MCQCLPCNCWWCNIFGVCGGYSHLLLICGYWCCKPEEMLVHNLACCYCCESAGYGSNCFCYGCVLCAPTWLQNYSKVANGKSPQQFGVQPLVVQHHYGQIGMGQPMTGQPMNGQQMYGQPMQQQPMYSQQMYGQPMNGQQMNGQPMNGLQMNGQIQVTHAGDATIVRM